MLYTIFGVESMCPPTRKMIVSAKYQMYHGDLVDNAIHGNLEQQFFETMFQCHMKYVMVDVQKWKCFCTFFF